MVHEVYSKEVERFAASLLERMTDTERVAYKIDGKGARILTHDAPVMIITGRQGDGFYAKSLQSDRDLSWSVFGPPDQRAAVFGRMVKYLEERLAEFSGCRS